jgi:hypothetical protein
MVIMKDALGASLMQIKFPHDAASHDAAEQIAFVKVGLVQPYLIQLMLPAFA